jgi:hypothetical protein
MSKIDEIKRIKTLLDDGLITQAEFDKLKGQILGGIESKQPESNVSEHRETTFTTSDTTNETSIATTTIEQVDDEPSKGRGLKIALAYIAAIAIIGGIIFWAYNKKTSHTESVSQQEIKDDTKTNIILREQNEKESNKSLSDLDDSSEGEHNTNAQSQDLNPNGNSQVEQTPIVGKKYEINISKNGEDYWINGYVIKFDRNAKKGVISNGQLFFKNDYSSIIKRIESYNSRLPSLEEMQLSLKIKKLDPGDDFNDWHDMFFWTSTKDNDGKIAVINRYGEIKYVDELKRCDAVPVQDFECNHTLHVLN